LFREDEEHEFKPKPDLRRQFSQAHTQHSESQETSINAGVSGLPPALVPSLEFHIQKNKSVTIDQDLKSWRVGISVGKCMCKLLSTTSRVTTLTGLTGTDKPSSCFNPKQYGRLHRPHYDYALIWSWQTVTEAPTWTPEVYQSVTLRFTIIRVLTVDQIKQAKHDNEMRKYLQFDFDVKVRVRELDCTWTSLFKGRGKPADVRRKCDTGMAQPADQTAFSIICTDGELHWPRKATYDIEKATARIIKKVKHTSPCLLLMQD
jgi:hypothetical protein